MIRRLFVLPLLWMAFAPAWPQSAPASLPGLAAPVQLTRDSDGITHVLAHNESDLWFMQGWVHASVQPARRTLGKPLPRNREPQGLARRLADPFGCT
jgi:Penicillin amidase